MGEDGIVEGGMVMGVRGGVQGVGGGVQECRSWRRGSRWREDERNGAGGWVQGGGRRGARGQRRGALVTGERFRVSAWRLLEVVVMADASASSCD